MPAAMKAFHRALSADAGSHSAMLGLALVAIHDRDWESASRWANGAIDLQAPAQPLAFYLRALANLELGRLDAAESSALTASRLDPLRRIAEIDQLLGVICALRHEYATAIQYFHEYLRHSTEPASASLVRQQLTDLKSLLALGMLQ
jgi:tetratricopeptide (TPR) repeat protein